MIDLYSFYLYFITYGIIYHQQDFNLQINHHHHETTLILLEISTVFVYTKEILKWNKKIALRSFS